MRVVETKVYEYEELSDAAKEKARDWYREGNLSSYEWWDYTYEWFETICNCLGVTIKYRSQSCWSKHKGHYTVSDPCIFFSGFCSQGDGASFQGTYSYHAHAGWAT